MCICGVVSREGTKRLSSEFNVVLSRSFSPFCEDYCWYVYFSLKWYRCHCEFCRQILFPWNFYGCYVAQSPEWRISYFIFEVIMFLPFWSNFLSWYSFSANLEHHKINIFLDNYYGELLFDTYFMSLGPIFSHIISVFFKTLNLNVIDDDHIWFSLIIQEILLDNPVFIYFGINLKSNMPSIHEPTWHSFVSTGTFCSRSYEGNVLYRE